MIRFTVIAALVAIVLGVGTAALASPGSGEGPITDVVGTFRLVKADGHATPFQIATEAQGPEGDGIRLKRGERVEVIGTGSSCLNPPSQQRHYADGYDHQASCGVDDEPVTSGVPTSWAR